MVDAGVDSAVGAVPRSSGAATRDRILAVALELFASKGYAATSVRDITERLGLTKASLYYHFASKEDILDALMRPLGQDLAELIAWARAEPVADARQILVTLVDLLCRRGAVVRALMAEPSGVGRSHARPDGAREHLRALVDILAEGDGGEGRIRARCALGAAQIGVFAAQADGPAGVTAPTAEQAHRLLAGELPLLDQASQRVVVDAAMRALGRGPAMDHPDG
ncbi:MAG: TetR/AcrR family transcriptional regulator [Acidimicrobiales bacterium]